jgi:hypothetical protein
MAGKIVMKAVTRSPCLGGLQFQFLCLVQLVLDIKRTMKFLTKKQSEDWLKSFNLNYFKDNLWISEARTDFLIPSDSGKKTAIARLIATSFCEDAEGLLLITDWSIWPSSENLELFRLIRLALGESTSLNETPGHCFASNDRASLECFLDIILYYNWDAMIFTSPKKMTCKLTNDDLILIDNNSGQCSNLIEDIKNLLGLCT